MEVRIAPERSKISSKNPIRNNDERNQQSFNWYNTTERNILPELVFLSPRPLASLVEHKGGMFLLVFKGMTARKLESRSRKQDERIASWINRGSASSSKYSTVEEPKEEYKNETAGTNG